MKTKGLIFASICVAVLFSGCTNKVQMTTNCGSEKLINNDVVGKLILVSRKN